MAKIFNFGRYLAKLIFKLSDFKANFIKQCQIALLELYLPSDF